MKGDFTMDRFIDELIKDFERAGETITREQAAEIVQNEICFGELEIDE